jgi:hypothetical protein
MITQEKHNAPQPPEIAEASPPRLSGKMPDLFSRGGEGELHKNWIHNTPLGWVLIIFAAILVAFAIGLMLGGVFLQNKLNQKLNNDLNKMMNDQPKQVQSSIEPRAKSVERKYDLPLEKGGKEGFKVINKSPLTPLFQRGETAS